jgi:hypothetical protein
VARLDGELAKKVAEGDLAATKAALVALGTASVDPSMPPASVRDRLLASVGRPGKFGIYADKLGRLFDLSMEEAAKLVARLDARDDQAGWMPFLVEGLELMAVPAGPKCDGAIATLVRLQPGKSFPHHAHRGDETMFVLDGGLREETGALAEVWRGDEMFRADGSEHSFVALPGVPCIAAVVIFGHGEFKQ